VAGPDFDRLAVRILVNCTVNTSRLPVAIEYTGIFVANLSRCSSISGNEQLRKDILQVPVK
jgi:hypothetical protein